VTETGGVGGVGRKGGNRYDTPCCNIPCERPHDGGVYALIACLTLISGENVGDFRPDGEFVMLVWS